MGLSPLPTSGAFRLPLLAFGWSGRGGRRRRQKADGKPPAHAERYGSPQGHLPVGEETYEASGTVAIYMESPGGDLLTRRSGCVIVRVDVCVCWHLPGGSVSILIQRRTEPMFDKAIVRGLLATTVVASAIVAHLASVSAARADNITYNIIDYPLDQGGHHLSGTIITDGVSSNLWGGEIVGGVFVIDGESYSIGKAFGQEANPKGIGPIATATEILLPKWGFFLIEHPAPEGSDEWQTIIWNRIGSWMEGYVGKSESASSGPTYWWNDTPASGLGHIAADDPWVIATAAPEPSSLVLLGIGVASLSVYAWRRRGQAV
jgi:hypothetical protein